MKIEDIPDDIKIQILKLVLCGDCAEQYVQGDLVLGSLCLRASLLAMKPMFEYGCKKIRQCPNCGLIDGNISKEFLLGTEHEPTVFSDIDADGAITFARCPRCKHQWRLDLL